MDFASMITLFVFLLEKITHVKIVSTNSPMLVLLYPTSARIFSAFPVSFCLRLARPTYMSCWYSLPETKSIWAEMTKCFQLCSYCIFGGPYVKNCGQWIRFGVLRIPVKNAIFENAILKYCYEHTWAYGSGYTTPTARIYARKYTGRGTCFSGNYSGGRTSFWKTSANSRRSNGTSGSQAYELCFQIRKVPKFHFWVPL